ncbi:MAG: hypothetical protein AAF961_06395 [Planctomycetota bacterium]
MESPRFEAGAILQTPTNECQGEAPGPSVNPIDIGSDGVAFYLPSGDCDRNGVVNAVDLTAPDSDGRRALATILVAGEFFTWQQRIGESGTAKALAQTLSDQAPKR